MSRRRFCEMLTSMANCPISVRDFEVSPPVAISGVRTSVMVRPLNRTRRYGFQEVEYNRFDLSSRPPVVLDWRGERSTAELTLRPDLPSHFPYRLATGLASTRSTPRKLRLTPSDVVDEPISALTNLTEVVLQALGGSDFFIGTWHVTLRRSL